MAKSIRRSRALPTRQDLVDFIASSPVPVGKRDLVRKFKVRPADRVALKGLIKDIERGGSATRVEGRRLATPETLPEFTVIEIVGIDTEGEPVCQLLGDVVEPMPRIDLVAARGEAALGIRDRAVVRLRRSEDGSYKANVVRKLSSEGERVLGVYRSDGTLTPTDRRNKTVYRIRPTEAAGAVDGEVVVAAPLPIPRLGLPHAQILERVGPLGDPKTISLIAIHSQSIPTGFPEAAIAEAEAARPVALGDRTDLRTIPLVTIDGADARDFDDAVWAEPDPEDPDGWHILVAIADVAWYVRPGSALDLAALQRGNSVYFPDRVVPMLPEALSNELCSLKPDVDRACLAIHMWLDKSGTVRRHAVVRGLMRSVARLTYEQVQAAKDGLDTGRTSELDPIIRPLYGAYAALDTARRARGTLDLDLPERKVVVAPDGGVARIERRVRLDSHKLIEEFMIAANVAAAETLEKLRRPCIYRVHDVPDPDRVDALRNVLDGIGVPGLKLAKGQVIRPHHFASVLARIEERPEAALVNELVLRCQAQAVYAPDNLGHFGLALQRYAHFTSPIRRYADLIVHRSLIEGLGLGDGGLEPATHDTLVELGRHVSVTERRAAMAERQALDRYIAVYLSDQIGASFEARISGAAKFGLFVRLDDSGADGLVPVSSLPQDFYQHDIKGHALVGQRTRRRYTVGDRVTVRLNEADTISSGLVFSILENGVAPARTAHRPVRRGRQPR